MHSALNKGYDDLMALELMRETVYVLTTVYFHYVTRFLSTYEIDSIEKLVIVLRDEKRQLFGTNCLQECQRTV